MSDYRHIKMVASKSCLKNLGLHAAVKSAVTVQTSYKLKQLITSLYVNCQQSLSLPKMYYL